MDSLGSQKSSQMHLFKQFTEAGGKGGGLRSSGRCPWSPRHIPKWSQDSELARKSGKAFQPRDPQEPGE